MAVTNNLSDFLTAIANKIRTKTGSSAAINAQDFITQIDTVYTTGYNAGGGSSAAEWTITNATLSNAGVLSAKNAAGTEKYTQTFTNSYDAGNTVGQATGKTNYEPTSYTLSNAGELVVKNNAGTAVYSATVTNSFNKGSTAGAAAAKLSYEPKSATITNAGALTVKNTAGNAVYSATISPNYDGGYSAGVTATKVGTATADKVLTGYTFTNASGVGINGTMASNSAGAAAQGVYKSTATAGYIYVHFPSGYWSTSWSPEGIAPQSHVMLTGSNFNYIGTAAASEVLSGKTFTSSAGVKISGTMTNNGATGTSITTNGGSYTIPAGYTSGGTVTTKTWGASDFASGNIELTAQTGTSVVGKSTASVKSGSATTPTTTITANPTLALNSDSTKYIATVSKEQNVTPTVSAGWVASGTAGKITVSGSLDIAKGAITNNTTLPSGSTSSGTITDGKYIKIAAGYYPNTLYYYAQNYTYKTDTAATIDVTDLTITPNALSGAWNSTTKKYVVSQASTTATMQSTVTTAGYISSSVGTKNTGTATVSAPTDLSIDGGTVTNNTTLPSGSTSSGTINRGSYIKISSGYYPSTVYYLAQSAPTLNGNASAANVLSGKTFYNNSYTQQTGTMTNNGATGGSIGYGESYTIPAGYTSGGTVTNSVSAGSVEGDWTANGISTYCNAGSASDYNIKITSNTSVTSGYVTGVDSETTEYYKLKTGSWGTGTAPSGTTPTELAYNTVYKISKGWIDSDTYYKTKADRYNDGVNDTKASKTTITPAISNSGLSTYFDAGTSSDKQLTLTPTYTNTAGYADAHTSAQSGTAAYYKIKTTSAQQDHGTIYWGTGWITEGSTTVTASQLGLTSKTAAQVITRDGGTVSYTKNTYSTSDASITVTASDLGYTSETALSGSLSGTTYTVSTPQTKGCHTSQLTKDVTPTTLGLTAKAAATITPTTSDQTIAKSIYTTGVQTIKGDANLVAGNIKSGTTIFGVTGTYNNQKTEQTKTASASASQAVEVTPDSGKVLSKVTINKVTSSIDSNITAGNIKSGVTILGVTGTHAGGITPTGTKTITQQTGTDVTNFATANVTGATINTSGVILTNDTQAGYVPFVTSNGWIDAGYLETLNIGDNQSLYSLNINSGTISYLNFDYGLISHLNFNSGGCISSCTISEEDSYISNLYCTHGGYINSLSCDSDGYVEHITLSQTGSIGDITGDVQNGNDGINRMQGDLVVSNVGESGHGSDTDLVISSVEDMASIHITTSMHNDSECGANVYIRRYSTDDYFCLGTEGYLNESTWWAGDSASYTISQSQINLAALTNKYVNISTGIKFDNETISIGFDAISVPMNAVQVLINVNSGTTYFNYNCTNTTTAAKVYSVTTSSTGKFYLNQAYNRIMTYDTWTTATRTFTFKFYNSSGTQVGSTVTKSIPRRYGTLMLNSVSTSDSNRKLFIMPTMN